MSRLAVPGGGRKEERNRQGRSRRAVGAEEQEGALRPGRALQHAQRGRQDSGGANNAGQPGPSQPGPASTRDSRGAHPWPRRGCAGRGRSCGTRGCPARPARATPGGSRQEQVSSECGGRRRRQAQWTRPGTVLPAPAPDPQAAPPGPHLVAALHKAARPHDGAQQRRGLARAQPAAGAHGGRRQLGNRPVKQASKLSAPASVMQCPRPPRLAAPLALTQA